MTTELTMCLTHNENDTHTICFVNRNTVKSGYKIKNFLFQPQAPDMTGPK